MSSRHYPHRLKFLQPVETVADSGQVTRTFVKAFSRRGRIAQTGGGKSDVAGQKQRAASFEIVLPHDRQLDSVNIDTWRIEWQDVSQTINLTSMSTDYVSRRPITTIGGTLNR